VIAEQPEHLGVVNLHTERAQQMTGLVDDLGLEILIEEFESGAHLFSLLRSKSSSAETYHSMVRNITIWRRVSRGEPTYLTGFVARVAKPSVLVPHPTLAVVGSPVQADRLSNS
jgi:hypothetical protein